MIRRACCRYALFVAVTTAAIGIVPSILWAACGCERCCATEHCHAFVSPGGTNCSYFRKPYATVQYNYTGPCGTLPLKTKGILERFDGADCFVYCVEFFGEDCVFAFPTIQQADCSETGDPMDIVRLVCNDWTDPPGGH